MAEELRALWDRDNAVYHARDEDHRANSASDVATSLLSLCDDEVNTSTLRSLCRRYRRHRADLITNSNASFVRFLNVGRGISPEERERTEQGKAETKKIPRRV